MYVSVSFSILFIEMSLVFILYTIYPFLKSGSIYVNRTTGEIYIGNGDNVPVEVIVMANDGTINIDNVQTISGMTMSEILEQVKTNGGGGGNVNISGGGTYVIRDYSDIITGTIVTGAEVTMSGMPWIVASIEPSKGIFYLISKYILGSCKFAESATNYTKSTLAKTLNTMLDTMDENVQEKLLPMLIGGLTQKIHAPTYGQITRWFTSSAERIAKATDVEHSAAYWLADTGITTTSGSNQFLCKNDSAMNVSEYGQAGVLNEYNSEIFETSLKVIQTGVTTSLGYRAVVALQM